MKELKIGIVGAGGIVASRHIPGLRNIEGISIVAVANSTLDSSKRFCSEFAPAAKPVETWQQLVAMPELDIVWIGATPFLHHPVSIAALTAGKHVFCQARMAMNHTQALEMLAASNSHPDLVTMLCPPPFGLEKDALVRRILAESSIGKIRQIRLRSLTGQFLDPSQPVHWRQRREISGNNVMSLGIYVEVLQRWFGDISSVSAQGRVVYPDRSGYRVQIPEVLDVIAEFTSGAVSSWHFSGVHPGESIQDLEIIGESGVLCLDFGSDQITLQRPGQPRSPQVPNPEEIRPWQVEADFIAAVRNPDAPRPHPSFRDGTAYMRVVDAVDASRQSGSRTAIEIPN